MGEKGRLRQTISRWANPENEEAEELQRDAARSGVRPIADAPIRERISAQGTLRTVTLRPRGGVPVLEAELYDGSGTLTLLWLGRRRISGVYPGRTLRVSGRIGEHEDTLVMFNPRYELVP